MCKKLIVHSENYQHLKNYENNSVKSTDETFDSQLLDPQSYKYVTLTEKVLSNVSVYKH
jgi:hypothetical protein